MLGEGKDVPGTSREGKAVTVRSAPLRVTRVGFPPPGGRKRPPERQLGDVGAGLVARGWDNLSEIREAPRAVPRAPRVSVTHSGHL